MSPPERHDWAICFTSTGAPTAEGFEYFIYFLAMFSNFNLLDASPLQFLGRYLFRRSKVGDANPCSFLMRFTAISYTTTSLLRCKTLSVIHPVGIAEGLLTEER